ncbi:MAG: hypothetical protein QM493_10590 [Sulfurovum sp.]
MIAFGYNIFFKNEPTLNQNSIFNNTISYIIVKEQNNITSFESSNWIELNNRNIRYHRFTEHNYWGFEIKNIITFIWDSNQKSIKYIKQKNYSKEALLYWTLHTFLPMALQLEQIYTILHVGAIEVNNEAIILSAPSFGGKSTLVGHFLQKGHALLSDDTLAIHKSNQLYYAIPSYPFYRPYRNAESLGKETKAIAYTSKPINSIYILQKSTSNSSIEIIEIFGIEKFKALNNALFIDFDNIKKESFIFLMEFTNNVSIYNINIPWDKDRLGEVYESIIKKTKKSSL